MTEIGRAEIIEAIARLADRVDDRWSRLTPIKLSRIWEHVRQLEAEICSDHAADRRVGTERRKH